MANERTSVDVLALLLEKMYQDVKSAETGYSNMKATMEYTQRNLDSTREDLEARRKEVTELKGQLADARKEILSLRKP
jgi:peptidoglycan hydrolase CwlO-like protein